MYDVTIIGGGIIGTAIARELMRYDVRAVLVEKEVEVGFGTSKSNSGIIHGVTVNPVRSKPSMNGRATRCGIVLPRSSDLRSSGSES